MAQTDTSPTILRAIRTIRYATVEEADQLSNSWTDEVLGCRSGILRHRWEPYTAIYNKEYRYTQVTVRCPRCTTRKRLEIDQYGRRLSKPRMSYPPGYLAKNVGRIIGDAQDWVTMKAVERLFDVTKLSAKESRESLPSPSAVRRLTEIQES